MYISAPLVTTHQRGTRGQKMYQVLTMEIVSSNETWPCFSDQIQSIKFKC